MKPQVEDRYKAIQDICLSESVTEAVAKWSRHKKYTKGCRAIFAFEDEGSSIPCVANSKVFLDKAFLYSLFAHNSIYCLDEKILSQYRAKRTAYIRFDYSISFDTNFASYLNSYVKGKDLGSNQDPFLSALDHIVENDTSFDYNPYVIENSSQILVGDKSSHIYETLCSIIKLTTIDREHYLKTREVRSLRSEESVAREALEKLDYHKSRNGKVAIKHVHRINRTIYLILLKICYLMFFDVESRSAQSKTVNLMRYMHNIIGAMFMRELVAGFTFFSDQNTLSIFNKIKPNSKRILKNLRNISWDFSMLRYLENFTSSFTKDFHYYYPCFLSFDKDLMELFNIQASRACFISKEKTSYFFPETDTVSLLYRDLDNSLLNFFFGVDGVKERYGRERLKDMQLNKEIEDLEALIMRESSRD